MKPRLLDLFCGAGGAAVGYHRAGFEVVGVDNRPQPNYPFEFVQAEALGFLGVHGIPFAYVRESFDAIHASPPCQAFTDLKSMYNAKEHEDLLTPTRELLEQTHLPFVIENVPGAPMAKHPTLNGAYGVELCGSMFRLGTKDAELRRHRLFESNFPMVQPGCAHGWAQKVIGVYGGHGRDRRRSPKGASPQDFSTEERREAMGIDWMTGAELSQAIPPAYTELIGHQLMQHLQVAVPYE